MLSRFIVLLFGLSVVFGRSQRLMEKKPRLERTNRGAEKYTIEIIVGVDTEMVEYYGNELNDVVLTAMNFTSDIFENSNLKQSISISVLNVMQLPLSASDFEDSPGVNGKYGQDILSRFCDHMKATSLEYDATVFITKSKLFTGSDPPSGFSGLAYRGTMCTPRACLILSDDFITKNWFAAHELGSVLVMTATLNVLGTQTPPKRHWHFSQCSQNAFDEMLAERIPIETNLPNMLDGLTKNPELFSPSRQCKEWFKERSDHHFETTDDCSKRWCLTVENMFYTDGPWSNGTPCGENKECQHRECIDA